jgi:hypothetical protein
MRKHGYLQTGQDSLSSLKERNTTNTRIINAFVHF